jgi:hypothetical protein
MPTRLSRSIFINKEHIDFIMEQIDDWVKNAVITPGHVDPQKYEMAIDLYLKIQDARKNKRFTIEAENCHEIVPPDQIFRRKGLANSKHTGYKRRGETVGGS